MVTMLQVPEEPSGAKKEADIPCFRCLFEKPISPSMCTPETCDMLEFWLKDAEFSWKKYLLAWEISVELKFIKKNGSPEKTLV